MCNKLTASSDKDQLESLKNVLLDHQFQISVFSVKKGPNVGQPQHTLPTKQSN